MKQRVEQVVKDVGRSFRDRRRQLFEIDVLETASLVRLSGKVLEVSDLQTLQDALSRQVPEARVDASDVRVLRLDPPELRTVVASITELRAEGSFLAETLSQVLNGARVEVLDRAGDWALIRQSDGYLGWVYGAYIGDVAPPVVNHLVVEPVCGVYHNPAEDTCPATRLLGGTAVRGTQVQGEWMRIEPAGTLVPGGWVPSRFLREMSSQRPPRERASEQMLADARRYSGVFYLWGGCSGFGIDCSGLVQLVHRLSGFTLPRDSDMQFDAGSPVEPPFRAGDLLFFHAENDRGRITHVGISIGGWRMIHSSRARNGVYEDDVQAVEHLRTRFAGARTFLMDR